MADSISRITSMLETARDLTLEAATAASSRLTVANATRLTALEISTLLNSRSERDVYQGLKAVVSMISRDEDASKLYTDVVKNVTSPNLKIKRLVYTYLLKYTNDSNEDIALLSINAIQKSLYDQDEHCRDLAMRMISEIKIRSIYQIVIIGLKKCVNDPSAIVRKAAAVSLVKIYQNHVDNDTCDVKADLMPHLEKLLQDVEIIVLNSAVLAYKLICPDNYSLVHGHYRRFVGIIGQFDEWSQVYLVELFTDYSRKFLPRPKIINLTTAAASNDGDNNEQQDFIELPDIYNGIPYPVYDVQYHRDLELFLLNIRPLLHSFNESLIMAISRAYFHLTPPKTFREAQIPRALVRVISTGSEEAKVGVLQMILYMVLQDPMNFVEFTRRFYLLPSYDSDDVVKYKLKILSIICNENNIKSIVTELQSYIVSSFNINTALESVKTLGICCQISEFWSGKTLKWMLRELTHSREPSPLPRLIRSEFLSVIRYLIQKDKQSNINTIARLALILTEPSSILTMEAKESIIWILGEFSELIPKLIPDILRQLLKSFHSYSHSPSIRYQIILLSAKIYIADVDNSVVAQMCRYAIQLGRYDDVIEVRDRSRFFHSLLISNPAQDDNSGGHQLASLILQVHKQVPLLLKRSAVDDFGHNNSTEDTSNVTVEMMEGLDLQPMMVSYIVVPSWNKFEDLPDDSVRDPIEVKSFVQNISGRDVLSGNNRSSSTYSGGRTGSPTVVISGGGTGIASSSLSSGEKKYNLQSLDDFFSNDDNDGSEKLYKKGTTGVLRKRIVYEEFSDSEESSSEEEEESDESSEEEEDDDGEEDEEEDEEEDDEEENEEENEEEDDDHGINYRGDDNTSHAEFNGKSSSEAQHKPLKLAGQTIANIRPQEEESPWK